MQLPKPQASNKVTVFLSGSYIFSTGHGSAVPMTSLNLLSKEASRGTKEIPLTIIKNTKPTTYSV